MRLENKPSNVHWMLATFDGTGPQQLVKCSLAPEEVPAAFNLLMA